MFSKLYSFWSAFEPAFAGLELPDFCLGILTCIYFTILNEKKKV